MSHPKLALDDSKFGDNVRKFRYLVTASKLPEYINFLKKNAISGMEMDLETVVDNWKQYTNNLLQLQSRGIPIKSEYDIIDSNPYKTSIFYSSNMENYIQCFAYVSTDQLACCQMAINLDKVNELYDTLCEKNILEDALPLEVKESRSKITHDGGNKYVVTSSDLDYRCLGINQIEYDDIKSISDVYIGDRGITISFGKGNPWISAVEFGDRLFLINGYHRSAAFLKNGNKKIPMIIYKAADERDLSLICGGELARVVKKFHDENLILNLSDYFDSRFSEDVEVENKIKIMQISIKIEESILDISI